MIDCNLFLCRNKDLYPPFKNGFYIEEYFLDKYNTHYPNTKLISHFYGRISKLNIGFHLEKKKCSFN